MKYDVMWPLIRPPFRAQIEALQKGAFEPGFNFFMEQGLGKSATTLANFELLRQGGKARKLLIISPNSFKGGWEREIRLAGLTTPVFIWTAGADARLESFHAKNKEWIIIVNYESLDKLASKYDHLLTGHDVMIVSDESIKLKSPTTRMSKAARHLAEHCGWRRLLSGKPVTQGPQDLWAQLKFMGFVKRMNFYAWRNRFCVMGGWQGKQVIGAQNQAELNRILQETSFLARKKDFTDLPPKLPPVTVKVDMLGEQQQIYKRMEKDFVASFMEGGEENRISVEQIITRDIKLRQIMSGWMYDEGGNVIELLPFEENPRFKALQEIITEQVNGKTVIVAWYKPTINNLLKALDRMGRNPAVIRGGMTSEEVEEQKRRFNEDDDCLDIVVQQVAGKYGHTLLGTRDFPCSTMLFFEQSYSLDDRSQIEDRIHRYGQVWPCSYFDFTAGKLDRAVVRALQRKESVAAAILGYAKGEPEPADDLQTEEEFLRREMMRDVQRLAQSPGVNVTVISPV